MEKIITIEGMKCSGCANRVKNALSSIKGIKKIDVNHETKLAKVTYKKDISNDDITRVINELNFKVISIEDK